MTTFNYNEVFDGTLPDIFNTFIREATKPFKEIKKGFIGTKLKTPAKAA